MTLPTRALTALVCDGDPVTRAAKDAGFEVLEQADNAARALQLYPFHPASLVITSQELPGMSGLEALADFRRLDNPPEVIIITADTSIRQQGRDEGAFAVIERGDTEALSRALADARYLFETGERRRSSDRRSGEDRRKKQDWSKVTIERRSGVDRRQQNRRRARDRDNDGDGVNASATSTGAAAAPPPDQH